MPFAQDAAGASDQTMTDNENCTPRYETCYQCEKEFDATTNKPDSCQWHDGELEVDFDNDFWADHDEQCHGEIDTEEMRKEFPDGFIWDCCRTHGNGGVELDSIQEPEPNVKGCQRGPHRSSQDGDIKMS